MTIQAYVVGFLIELSTREVVLIRKTKPDWQRGKLNGVGGKIERDEKPLDAMEREFREEAGAIITTWHHFATLTDCSSFEVFMYRAFASDLSATCRSCEDEKLEIIPLDELEGRSAVPNLRWLIPMALTMEVESCQRFHITEICLPEGMSSLT